MSDRDRMRIEPRGGGNHSSRLAAMASRGRIFLLVLASAALLAGCGSDGGEIPPESAEMMQTRLNEVQRGIDTGNCEGEPSAEASANLLRDHIDDLPADVDTDVREALVAAADRLQQLVDEECVESTDEIDTGGEEPAEPEVLPEETDPVEPEVEETPPEDEGDESGEGSDENGSPENGPQGQGPDGEGPPGQGARTPPSGGTGAPRRA